MSETATSTPAKHTVPLSALTPGRFNVRTSPYDPKRLKTFSNELVDNGQLHPLTVVDAGNGKYTVEAGGRRLAALQLAVKDKRIKKNHPVWINTISEENARHFSLSENANRERMSTLDSFEAYAALRRDGRSFKDIAAYYGVTSKSVKQCLALSDVHQNWKTMFRHGDITRMSTLEALASATPETQKSLYKQFKAGDIHEHDIGYQIRQGEILLSRAIFDTKANPVTTITDLFGDDSKTIVTDIDAFWKFQLAALDEKVKAHQDEGRGAFHYSEESEIDSELAQEWGYYEDEDLPAEIVIGYRTFSNGHIATNYFRVITDAETGDDSDHGSTSVDQLPPELTKSGEELVAIQRAAIVQEHVAANPHTALVLYLTSCLTRYSGAITDGNTLALYGPNTAEDPYATSVADGIAATLPDAHGFPQLLDVYNELKEQTTEQLLDALARLIALNIKAGSPLLDLIGTDHNLTPETWEITEDFAKALKGTAVIDAALTDACIDPATAGKTQKAKRGRLLDSTTWVPPYVHFPMGKLTDESDVPELGGIYRARKAKGSS